MGERAETPRLRCRLALLFKGLQRIGYGVALRACGRRAGAMLLRQRARC